MKFSAAYLMAPMLALMGLPDPLSLIVTYLTIISGTLLVLKYFYNAGKAAWSRSFNWAKTWQDLVSSVRRMEETMSQIRDMLSEGSHRMDAQDKRMDGHDARLTHVETIQVDHEARIRVVEAKKQ